MWIKAALHPCCEDLEALWQEEALGLPHLSHPLLELSSSQLTRASAFDLSAFPAQRGLVSGGPPALLVCQAASSITRVTWETPPPPQQELSLPGLITGKLL